mgnify:CR=1 FL=1
MTEQDVRRVIDELLAREWGGVPFDQMAADFKVRHISGPGYRASWGWVLRDKEFPDHPHPIDTWTYTIAGRAQLFEERKQPLELVARQLICTPAGTVHRSKHYAGYEGIELSAAPTA